MGGLAKCGQVHEPGGPIPAPYESLVYYYGVYSSSYRGKQRRENREEQETELVLMNTGKPAAGKCVSSPLSWTSGKSAGSSSI